MATVKELRERRVALWNDMKALLERTEDNGMTADESSQYEGMESELTRLGSDIEARERAAELEKRLAEPQAAPEGLVKSKVQEYQNQAKAYRGAFNKWLRGDVADLSNEERRILATGRAETRDLSTGVGSAGGYLVPDEFANRIFEHMKHYGGVRQVAGNITTASGADLFYPNLDDTSNVGAILAEGGAISEQDVSFGARTLKSHTYTSKLVQVTWQLMQDSAFSIEEMLSRVFADRLGRIQNTHFTTGQGNFEPEGIVTNATTVATDTNDALELSDVLKLIYNVDRAYRTGGVLMMHDLILHHLRKEQSTTGEFVWQPSAQAGEPDRLFGYPVVTNNDMASTVADGNEVVLFGDLRAGYLVRDVKGITVVRLRERYADNLMDGFFAYLRTDGQPTYQSGSSVPPYKALSIQ